MCRSFFFIVRSHSFSWRDGASRCDLESCKARRLSSWQDGISEAQPKLVPPEVSNIMILMKLSIAVGILSFRHAALLRTSLSSSYPKSSSSSFLQNALSAIGSFPFGGDGSRVLLNRSGPGLELATGHVACCYRLRQDEERISRAVGGGGGGTRRSSAVWKPPQRPVPVRRMWVYYY